MEVPSTEETLTDAERAALLKLARATIRDYLGQKTVPAESSVTGHLAAPRGCFVTLHRGGRLRGCIGRFASGKTTEDWSLAKTVQLMAIEAATGDPRFPPVTLDEVDSLRIEISALTPARPIARPDEIVVGRDGLIVSCGGRRGVLLPQVPVEQGWDRETFLDHTCLKAGLDPKAWRRGEVGLEVFTAEVFSEGKVAQPVF